jgi:hypothetical protein
MLATAAGAAESNDPNTVVATVRPVFASLAPTDGGVYLGFSYKIAGTAPEKTHYRCYRDTDIFHITTPTGKHYALSLIDKSKPASRDFCAVEGIGRTFDSIGSSSEVIYRVSKNGHHRVWKQSDIPDFTIPGEYRIVEIGVFRDSRGKLPDLPFRTNEAVWTVDPNKVPFKVLIANARKIVASDLGSSATNLIFGVSSDDATKRFVTGILRKEYIPSNRITKADRHNDLYDGLVYRFTFALDGTLSDWKSEESRWLCKW